MASVKGSCTLFLFLQLKIDTYFFMLKNPPTFKHIVYQIRLDSVKAQSSAQKSFFYWNKTKLPAGCHTGGNTTFLKLLLFFSQIYIYQCIYIMNVCFCFFFFFFSFWSAIIPCRLHQAHSAFESDSSWHCTLVSLLT